MKILQTKEKNLADKELNYLKTGVKRNSIHTSLIIIYCFFPATMNIIVIKNNFLFGGYDNYPSKHANSSKTKFFSAVHQVHLGINLSLRWHVVLTRIHSNTASFKHSLRDKLVSALISHTNKSHTQLF